jgi:hypothetical protein
MRQWFFAVTALLVTGASGAAQQMPIVIEDFTKPATAVGTVVSDPKAPVSFQLAPGWSVQNGLRWGNHETTLWFTESGVDTSASLYYQYPVTPDPPADAQAALREGIEAKVRQRINDELIVDYQVRPNSIQTRTVGGNPAISFIADFTQNGEPKVEYMVRVLGKTAKAHFFVMTTATADVDEFFKRLDAIVATLQIP